MRWRVISPTTSSTDVAGRAVMTLRVMISPTRVSGVRGLFSSAISEADDTTGEVAFSAALRIPILGLDGAYKRAGKAAPG